MSTLSKPPLETGEFQNVGELADARLGLGIPVRLQSVRALNRLLAHTMAIRDAYKKAHWQTSGPTFFQLHTLFDQHYTTQVTIMDALAERVQTLGGTALALAQDVVNESSIALAPRERESVHAQIARLIDAHETILTDARPRAQEAATAGDDGTNDVIVSLVIRINELQSWMVSEHLAADAAKKFDDQAVLLQFLEAAVAE